MKRTLGAAFKKKKTLKEKFVFILSLKIIASDQNGRRLVSFRFEIPQTFLGGVVMMDMSPKVLVSVSGPHF